MSYSRLLWNGLTDVFDVCLKILCRVTEMMNTALGHTSTNYRLLHSCPPCQYKVCATVPHQMICSPHGFLVEDEPLLEISVIGAQDGNQSLKRADLRSGVYEDPRRFDSSYHLSEEKVDVFKYDIKPRGNKAKDVSGCLHLLSVTQLIILLERCRVICKHS